MDILQEYIKLGCPVSNCHNFMTDIQAWLRDIQNIHIRIDITYSTTREERLYWAELFDINSYNRTYASFNRMATFIPHGKDYDAALLKGIEAALEILKNREKK